MSQNENTKEHLAQLKSDFDRMVITDETSLEGSMNLSLEGERASSDLQIDPVDQTTNGFEGAPEAIENAHEVAISGDSKKRKADEVSSDTESLSELGQAKRKRSISTPFNPSNRESARVRLRVPHNARQSLTSPRYDWRSPQTRFESFNGPHSSGSLSTQRIWTPSQSTPRMSHLPPPTLYSTASCRPPLPNPPTGKTILSPSYIMSSGSGRSQPKEPVDPFKPFWSPWSDMNGRMRAEYAHAYALNNAPWIRMFERLRPQQKGLLAPIWDQPRVIEYIREQLGVSDLDEIEKAQLKQKALERNRALKAALRVDHLPTNDVESGVENWSRIFVDKNGKRYVERGDWIIEFEEAKWLDMEAGKTGIELQLEDMEIEPERALPSEGEQPYDDQDQGQLVEESNTDAMLAQDMNNMDLYE